MNRPAHYENDVLFFFDGRPLELSLYEALFRRLDAEFPDASVKVQKSQISFSGRHLFGAVSLPVRRKKDWPERCLVVTIGLSYPLNSPRVAVAVEPYPNRWTPTTHFTAQRCIHPISWVPEDVLIHRSFPKPLV